MAKVFPGTHIYESEYRCQCCGKLPPDFYITIEGKRQINVLYALLFYQFEKAREKYGEPIPITRGYSCLKHNLFIYLSNVLRKYGGLTKDNLIDIMNDPTITPYGVHPFGLGLDLRPPKERIPKLIKILKSLGIKMRIGWKAYRNNPAPHIHTDIGWKINPRYSKNLREGAEW